MIEYNRLVFFFADQRKILTRIQRAKQDTPRCSSNIPNKCTYMLVSSVTVTQHALIGTHSNLFDSIHTARLPFAGQTNSFLLRIHSRMPKNKQGQHQH